ncbi:SDR family NAD(P)-dependent oxidoreductase [Bacillus sp. B15-48]|uniref:SDR family NAD(P)-dependent oxidoreductase n=1 Tax=Bacillus sp. B15-48 TaxID=1548601 RepID=UPI00193F6D36|nr:SDR family NAD(P)-dependent oxidoreductase [Bacillus sp. B15-48]MBM4763783.1 SDR family oxidoreductase [Bacillus sp. B15-48]
MITNLKGKVALVTGGTNGIGKATALKLAESGADVVIVGRNQEAGNQIVSEIKQMGRRSLFLECDLWEYDSVKKMTDQAAAEMGKIDILISNGGTTVKYAKFFHELDPNDYAGCLNTQQFTRLYTIRAALDHMREQNYGKIIIITSDAGRVATPRESLIGSSAAGLVLMNKALASEFARWQIRVNTLCLTVIEDTPAFDEVMSSEASHVFKKAVDRARLGLPNAEDVAEAALFFASPESDKITGQTLSINGGLSFSG